MKLALTTLESRIVPAWLITTASGTAGAEPLGLGIYRVDTPEALRAIPDVVTLEEDQPITAEQFPNDPSAPSQYALHTIQAPAAWDVTTGSSVVVAVIDSGVDITHPDLAANIWTNPGEIAGNNLDDDHNGYIDDVHGYDFADNDADPQDSFGHGTHVAGILGAVGNNAVGVTGVAWHTQIMPLRFLDAHGNGSTSDAIRALAYAVANGAKISNNSWGGATQSEALRTAIANAQTAGHIVVAAAGNRSANTDLGGNFPASFAGTFDNVVSVAATNVNDRLASFSNFGRTTVTLAAPGDSILSTLPGNRYGPKTGTSMATPFVSGALALAWGQHPEWSYSQVISQLKATVDPLPSLALTTETGGRLNLSRLLGGVVTVPPSSPPTSPPTVPPGSPPVPPPPPLGFTPVPVTPLPAVKKETIVVGSPEAGQATIRVLNTDGSVRDELLIVDGAFNGGARVATGDFNGDDVDDLVLGTSPGVAARVRILDGATHAVLWDFLPFGEAFKNGVFVATGDVTHDGTPDLAITPDRGGGARVRIFNGSGFTQIADFFGIDDPKFRGGARAAIGDLNGDGAGDLALAAGTGGGPRVATFDGTTLATHPERLSGDFFAFEPTLRNGTYLALGDLDGDGCADLIAGAGPGGGPRVSAFSGKSLLQNHLEKIADFFAGDLSQRDGVRVAVKDLDGDSRADLVIGGTSTVSGYSGLNLTTALSPTTQFGFDSDLGLHGGVFVG